MPGVMGNDPTLEKACRNGKPGLPRSDRLQSKAPKPAIEDSVADFRPQAVAAAPPGFAERRPSGTAMDKAIRIGFVVHIHGCVSGVGWTADVAAMPWNGTCLTVYVCVQGNEPAFHPLTPPLRRESSSGPSNPSDTLKQAAHPPPVIALAAWRDRAPERHKKTSEAPRSTPPDWSSASRRAAKFVSTAIEG